MLFRKSVDGILAVFTKTIKQLEDEAENHIIDAVEHEAEVISRSKAADWARKEADRAKTIANKLKGLVG